MGPIKGGPVSWYSNLPRGMRRLTNVVVAFGALAAAIAGVCQVAKLGHLPPAFDFLLILCGSSPTGSCPADRVGGSATFDDKSTTLSLLLQRAPQFVRMGATNVVNYEGKRVQFSCNREEGTFNAEFGPLTAAASKLEGEFTCKGTYDGLNLSYVKCTHSGGKDFSFDYAKFLP